MPRGYPKRLTALLGAVIFLLTVAGEGFGLHPCPYHGATPAGETAEATPPHHPTRHGDHGAAGGHGDTAGADDPAPGQHHSGAEPCTHFEACQSAAGAVVANDVVAAEIWAHTILTASAIAPPTLSLPPPPPFLLPYGQAPPARG